MRLPRELRRPFRNERGVVLIVVLVIAFAFAILAFTVLRASLNSLDTSDTFQAAYAADLIAEGGISKAAKIVRDSTDPHKGYIDPADAMTGDDSFLKNLLMDPSIISELPLESFPISTERFERTGYTFDSATSTYWPDTNLIPGDRDNSVFRFLDDSTFSEDYPGYEFAPVKQSGDLVVFGSGEVRRKNSDMSALSFIQSKFPTAQWNMDVREAGVTEPSRLGPYPYIETEHPYPTNRAQAWVVSYMEDPAHPKRNMVGLRLKAQPNEVQVDSGDTLYISAWLDSQGRFQKPAEIPLAHILGGATPYSNGTNEVFTQGLNTHTIGLFLQSDALPPDPNYEYGFRISGVRYEFDSDQFLPYYETPHPYDHLVDSAQISKWNVQTVLAPYQSNPVSPSSVVQRMRIQFDNKFSLDAGDTLYLFNTTDPGAPVFVDAYTAASPPPGGYSPQIIRVDPTLPLGMMLLLARSGGVGDTDGVANYGYKVQAIEYTDKYGAWIRVENPVMETPHTINLGETERPFNLPAGLPGIPLPGVYPSLAGYQTIYQPAVPNTDAPSGVGSVTNWWVEFEQSANFTATSGAANSDYLQIQTPGNILVSSGILNSDTIFFVHPDSALGPNIGADYRYFDIESLQELRINCGLATEMIMEFISDDVDTHEASIANFGYTVAQVGYETNNGTADDDTPPTIRSEMNYPFSGKYPAYGAAPLEYAEWWYTNRNANAVGLHFDRNSFDIDPGDRIEIYDENGILVATLVSNSVQNRPDAGGPNNPDQPSGNQQGSGAPGAGGPYLPDGTVSGTVIDLDSTYGWVVIKGSTATVRLIGDSDDNDGYAGFEIDHCGFVNGDVTEIQDYVTEFQQLARDEYYDRTAHSMSSIGSIGSR